MEIIGINKDNVEKISKIKKESNKIRDFRLDSFNKFVNI